MTMSWLVLLTLFALIPPSAAAQESPSGSCPCTLKGVVVNAVTGIPVRNALVESSSGLSSSMLTDSGGAFHFNSLAAGSATLNAIKPGFLSVAPLLGQPRSFRVAPDAPDVVLKLVPTAVLRGHITDDHGLPLENVSVKLLRREPGPSTLMSEQTGSAQTNDLGNFRIPDQPPGTYFLAVDPGGTAFHFLDKGNPTGFPHVYYPGVPDLTAATPIKLSAGREAVADMILAAAPYVRISGRITGFPQGASVQAALSVAFDPDNPASLEVDPQTGLFHSDWIAPGSYVLSAIGLQRASTDAGRVLTARQPVLALSEVTGLAVVLEAGVRVPIYISGIPVKEDLNRVSLTAKSGLGEEIGSATPAVENNPVQATADMWFESLPQGTYHLDISASLDEPYFVESARFGSTDLLTSDFVVDSSASLRSIDIVFRKGAASVSGTVNLKDAAHGAVVCLIPDKFGATPFFDSTSSSGGFMFQDLAPGAYRIVALDGLSDFDFKSQEGLKKLTAAAAPVTLAPAQNLQITLDITSVKE